MKLDFIATKKLNFPVGKVCWDTSPIKALLPAEFCEGTRIRVEDEG